MINLSRSTQMSKRGECRSDVIASKSFSSSVISAKKSSHVTSYTSWMEHRLIDVKWKARMKFDLLIHSESASKAVWTFPSFNLIMLEKPFPNNLQICTITYNPLSGERTEVFFFRA